MKRTISRALALAVIITAMLPSAGTAPPPDRGPAMMIESPVATTGFWTGLGPVQSTQMGISLAIGDVNGDGIDDVIAGGHDYARDYLKEGAVFVFFGPLSGTTMSPSLTITGGGAFFRLGWAVGVGDFNADGYDDIIAGYYGYENSALIEPGRVQVHYGGPGGPSSTPDWSAESDRDNTFFGTAVAAGDVNGDGFDDAIVGAESFDVTVGSSEGRVYLFRGSANGLENDAGWTYLGTPGSSTGYSVAAAGDVNGDGYGDLLIGGIRDYAGGDNNGYVALIPGAAIVPAANPIWTQVGVNGDFLGSAVSTAGDVNGDLFADVVVSNTLDTVFLYKGGAPTTGLETEAAWIMTVSSPTQTTFGDGGGLRSAGDVNGDGYDDVLIGANSFTGDITTEGAAYLFLGTGFAAG